MKRKPAIQFQTKVLVPTILVMAILLAMLMYVVNRRFTTQFTNEARDKLTQARAIFKNSERMRVRGQIDRYRTWANEPRAMSLFQNATLKESKDTEAIKLTIKDFFQKNFLPQCDFVAFSSPDWEMVVTATDDPLLNVSAFLEDLAPVIEEALAGDPIAQQGQIESRIFDVVSIPVIVSSQVAGILTVGLEISSEVLQGLKQLTEAEVAIVAGNSISVSTVGNSSVHSVLLQTWKDLLNDRSSALDNRQIVLAGEHFLVHAQKLLDGEEPAGYLLLSSYEGHLKELYATQRMLFSVGLAAIAIGGIAVGLIVRKLTQPLRELRAGAEAVGSGNLSHQVIVNSNDECGDLARAFNEMTASLSKSHAQLEQTLESLKTTQAQLIQREKLSAIGEFIAGVTHELNNPLTVVIGMSELLKTVDRDPAHQRYLDTIVSGSQRCHKIVGSLLSFARQHQAERKLVNLNDLVEATLTFMHYELRTSNIEVIREFASALPPVCADPHQVQQVFLNIVNNARQAMESAHKGSLRVKTEHSEDKVFVTFSDSGPGIAPENIEKLFTPFFTTKEVGKGTGLGLSVSHGIIQEHGGDIQVRSEVGRGTSFIIQLPVAAGHAESQAKPDKRDFSISEGAGKRVLAIDDEQNVLELIEGILNSNGYAVDTARDGQMALAMLGKTAYDLTICDWKMPGLSGQQIYQRLLQSNPAAAGRLVFMTADVMNETTRQFLQQTNIEVLAKPFAIEDLRELVRKRTLEEHRDNAFRNGDV